MRDGLKFCFAVIALFAISQCALSSAHIIRGSSIDHLPVHNLDTGLDYATIQEAIDAYETLDGHVISVDAGMYVEHILINKALSIVGESSNTTIIRGQTQPDPIVTVFCITANNVTLDGFTIRDGAVGIDIRANFASVANCTISNNLDGICSIYSTGSNMIIRNNIINNQVYGVILYTANNVISENVVTSNFNGITLIGQIPSSAECSGNAVIGNIIMNNQRGVGLYEADNNTFRNNLFADNHIGVRPYFSNNNLFSHNHFLDNNVHASSPNATNKWDDGYPCGGNYWDDYAGSDGDQDGIGDEPYLIDENNQDSYPLMGIVSNFNIQSQSQTYSVTIASNSTIENFSFNADGSVRFNVGGTEGTVGFCAICIPKALLNTPYTICIGNHSPTMMKELISTNETHAFLYFTYEHTADDVTIIPELSPIAFMPIIFLSMTIAFFLAKKNRY